MEKEIQEELQKKFEVAYCKRFGKDDIDWKPTLRKDKRTGEMVEGKPLAYLNWAVAWRAMKEIYPDANYRVVETPEGSPLWNINGYGMVKCAVSTMGVEHVETFPVMQGGRNDSMKIEEIDGRDVNDSIQRGLTKACARFGIGLYIYEGKLESQNSVPAKSHVNYEPLKKEEDNANPATPVHTDTPIVKVGVPLASARQKSYINSLLTQKGMTAEAVKNATNVDLTNMDAITTTEAGTAITFLVKLPAVAKKAPEPEEYIKDEDLPF